jgi:hypothetical protein
MMWRSGPCFSQRRRARRWHNTHICESTQARRCISVTPTVPGRKAATRTLTSCSDSTSQRAQISQDIPSKTSPPSPPHAQQPPRKTLQWRTPAETLTNHLNSHKTTALRPSVESAQFTSWAFSRKLQDAGLAPSMGAVGAPGDHGRVVLGTHAGRATQPQTMEDQARARDRDPRLHRDLPQHHKTPQRAEHAYTNRIREPPPINSAKIGVDPGLRQNRPGSLLPQHTKQVVRKTKIPRTTQTTYNLQQHYPITSIIFVGCSFTSPSMFSQTCSNFTPAFDSSLAFCVSSLSFNH